jgi:hypothetical protein
MRIDSVEEGVAMVKARLNAGKGEYDDHGRRHCKG